MNINIRLNKNFTTQFNKLQEKYGEEFAKLQGLSDDKLSLTDFINGFVDSDNVANSSIDANSNIGQKDVVTLISEMSKPHKKLLAFNKIYYELNKKYSFKEANKIIEELWNYSSYLHDFDTSTFYSYCFAYDIKDIVEQGLFFIEGYNAEPPKHLDSFIQILLFLLCLLPLFFAYLQVKHLILFPPLKIFLYISFLHLKLLVLYLDLCNQFLLIIS